jgi:hypothetical protein
MSAKRYQLLGFLVWQGGKWYLRRRLRPARKRALGGLLAGATLTAAGLAAKRLGS